MIRIVLENIFFTNFDFKISSETYSPSVEVPRQKTGSKHIIEMLHPVYTKHMT